MASFGVYVPDNSQLLNQIQTRADAEHDGKVSAYARAAIERDLAGGLESADPLAPDILFRLMASLMGQLDAQELSERIVGQDQPRLLRAMLANYLEALRKLDDDYDELRVAEESAPSRAVRLTPNPVIQAGADPVTYRQGDGSRKTTSTTSAKTRKTGQ